MPRRPWPNTTLWTRVEKHLRETYGRSWRRGGEKLFGLPPGTLRAHFDRVDIAEPEIRAIEDAMIAHVRRRAARYRRLFEIERRAEAELVEDCRQHAESRLARAIDRDPDEMTLFLRLMDMTGFHSDEEREATKAAYLPKAA